MFHFINQSYTSDLLRQLYVSLLKHESNKFFI